MKQLVIGAVLGAVVILAIGGAVVLGMQLDGGQKGQNSQQSETAAPAPNAAARREFIRFCEDVLNSSDAVGGMLGCECEADAIEARTDPATLTSAEAYSGVAADDESIVRDCMRD
jgi:phage terminase large subunit-like protein